MNSSRTKGTVLRAKSLAIAGVLGAVSIVLGMTPLGFIPVPTAAGHATIMHIPAVLAGVLEGPVTGGLVGLIFGLHSFIRMGSPLFADPVIAVLPRIMIGVVAHLAYRLTGSVALAAALGTVTNTAGVLGLAVVRGYIAAPVAWGIAVTHGFPEVVVAVLLTTLVYKSLKRTRR
ncbi:ECF transporter S component [Thermosediminibacter oceani]|uniref:Membrane protein-like protein n=1 Tax=Thermosediminibacter oceani (strain ATCC BAA-1034 / DSM 16646 / JW/IW-1228P) TaxID=555079 RepID=D9S0E2_THEOJ|nr:ECF transporter S component [Thermosediminibacter oceani]ADL08800.1 membrane protein-like protein [Thermosediminibacter oceani DSM 16646]